MSTDPDLESAYALGSKEDNQRLYARWAESYDAEFISKMDYRLPFEVARAYALAQGAGPVLDVGAGTGAVAEHLLRFGVTKVDGTDISDEMLDVAAEKRLYQRVFQGDVTTRLDASDDTYCGVVSAGTFTLGHVGPDAIDELLRIAKSGALFVLSINKAHYETAGFAEKMVSIKGKIENLSLKDVAIYGPNSTGPHALDRAYIVQFRKV